MRRLSIIVLCAWALLSTFSCTPKTTDHAVVQFFTGTAEIQSSGSVLRKVQLKQIVHSGDRIKTGDNSFLIIQIGEDLLFRVGANTDVSISQITSSKNALHLNKGTIISNISKLQKGCEYKIDTPTAVASVRGTEFMTKYNDGNTIVAVGTGKVSVTKTATKEEKIIAADKAIVITESTKTREIDPIEKLEIGRMAYIPIVKDIEKANPQLLHANGAAILAKDQKTDSEIDKLNDNIAMSLALIMKKYKRIDVITLYNGKIYQGAIVARGASFKVITPDGTVILKAKDIKRTEVK